MTADPSGAATPRPTMADVAALAGVSVKTVSRVVNGEAYVTAATEARVNDAARELGFRANLAAATLARGDAPGSLGLVIGDVADPFYARLARGVEQVAVQQGHVLLVASSGEDSSREHAAVDSLAGRHVSGVVVVPSGAEQPWLDTHRTRGLRAVFVDRPGDGSVDAVLTDNVTGARTGVAHLLAGGRRRVAFVGNDASVYTSQRRLEGFRSAHRDARVPVDPALVCLGPRTVAEAEHAVRTMLSGARPPDAIFAQNDVNAVGAWRAVHATRAPVAIVGFDDFELADVLEPPVTAVLQDAVELGRRAAQLLFDRVDGRFGGPPRTELVPTRLVVR